MICIVDYGMGNLQSVQAKFEYYLKIPSQITSDPKQILQADGLILPGVGHFKEGMQEIRSRDLLSPLREVALDKKTPVLGICLGMQLLCSHSEEGDVEGLNFIPGKVKNLKNLGLPTELRIPHIGWNQVHFKKTPIASDAKNFLDLLSSELNADNPRRFYFVHSFGVKTDLSDHSIGTTEYGIDFDSVIQKGNVIGTQFHPEKSHQQGLSVLKAFSEFCNVSKQRAAAV